MQSNLEGIEKKKIEGRILKCQKQLERNESDYNRGSNALRVRAVG